MARTQPSPVSTSTIADAPRYAVYWGATWATWAYAAHVYVLNYETTLAPTIPTARLQYVYGEDKDYDETAFSTKLPLDRLGWYVRIDETTSRGTQAVWYGRITSDNRNVMGDGTTPTGSQMFSCAGLEIDLDRSPVHAAYWKRSTTYELTNWVPRFNVASERGLQLTGNRASEKVSGSDSYYFSADGDGETWTDHQVIDYLLDCWGPAGLTVTLTGQTEVLDMTAGPYRTEGLTVRSLLNQIINPRRGLSWYIVSDGTNIAVHVITLLDETASTPEWTMPANNDIVTVDLTDNLRVKNIAVGQKSTSKYASVWVYGSRIFSCFTLQHEGTTLENAWSSAMETKYNDAASGMSGYGDLEEEEQARVNDAARGGDKFRAVYSHFRPPTSWNFINSSGDNAIPSVTTDGRVDEATQGAKVRAGKSFENVLPLRTNYNYSTGAAVDQDSDGTHDYLKPFALVWYSGDDDDEDVQAGWRFAERTPNSEKNAPGASIKMLDTELGVAVDFNPNHILARGFFDPESDEPTAERNEPLYSYTDMLVTVAMRTDDRLQVVKYTGADAGSNPACGELVIYVDDAEYHWVAPRTLFGLDSNGDMLVTPSAITLRDDGAKLRAVAELAAAWYGKDRHAVTVEYHNINRDIDVGCIMRAAIPGLPDANVNTVVTRRMVDVQAQTCIVQTEFAELDWQQAVGLASVNYPDERSLARTVTRLERDVDNLSVRTGGIPSRSF